MRLLQIIKVVSNIILKVLPVKNNYIYFYNIWGKYNDNTKYISEKLHEIYPDILCIWELDKMTGNEVPTYVKIVHSNTLKSYYFKNRSRILVDNGIGYISKEFLKATSFKKKLYLASKNSKQFNISTWHGTPLKHIFKDIPNRNYEDFISTTDIVLTGDNHTVSILEKATFGKVRIERIGSPRNDALILNSETKKIELKSKLKLPSDKKIILYAPTFRSGFNSIINIYKSGLEQMEQIDFDILFRCLNKKYGGDWVFVSRFHPGVSEKVNSSSLEQKSGGAYYNGNYGDDMTEYLLVSDILITDYSSSMFDFSLMKKPCFLFCPDINYYEKVERGFYLDIRNLPYPLAENFDELINNINLFSQEEYENELGKLMNFIGNIDDGDASNRVVQIIERFIREGDN